MIVAVESNFILEIAFEQPGAAAARQMLDLSEAGMIELIVPSCALAEPFETLYRHTRRREEVAKQLQHEVNQLVRSAPFVNLGSASAAITAEIATSITTQASELERTILRLCSCATIAPLSVEAVTESFRAQRELNLSPQDAFVFASVESHLKNAARGPKLFVNRDRRGFLTDEVQRRLAQYECRVLPAIDSALGYIQSEVQSRNDRNNRQR